MVGRVGVLILWVCLCGYGVGVVRCQKNEFAPRNVTVKTDATTLHVAWLTSAAAAKDATLDKKLAAFRVRVEPRNEPQLVREHWVPKGTGDAPYGHKVTCLRPSLTYQVTVLAVYDASANVSEADALSLPVFRSTKAQRIWDELAEHPVPMAVGASLMLLMVIIVVTVLVIYRCRRLRRRRRLRLNSPDNNAHARQKGIYRKSPTTTTTTTKLPTAEELRVREQGNNYHLVPVPASASASTRSPARAIRQPGTANQRSPLIQYSPPTSYQASTSVPSQVAPGRPGEDSDDLDSEDYENVLAVNTPVKVIIKSTSFSGGCRPAREGVRVPACINEGRNDGEEEEEEDGEEEDGDVGTYENHVIGRRCATMPSKSRGGRGVRVEEKECSIYGNWQR